jgi:acyl-CoA dehydrogenase
MPQDSSLEVAGRIDDWRSLAKHDGQEVARTIGVRLLAHDIVGEIRDLLAQVQPGDDATSRALAAFDLLSSVARQPRKVRQIRLGNSVWSEKQQ